MAWSALSGSEMKSWGQDKVSIRKNCLKKWACVSSIDGLKQKIASVTCTPSKFMTQRTELMMSKAMMMTIQHIKMILMVTRVIMTKKNLSVTAVKHHKR